MRNNLLWNVIPSQFPSRWIFVSPSNFINGKFGRGFEFIFSFDRENESYSFALTYPYSYSRLVAILKRLSKRRSEECQIIKMETIAKSLVRFLNSVQY